MLKHFLAILIRTSACILPPARAEDAAAPFDGDLQRLAEILGTLHYLRGICGTNEGPKWRNEMQALIDAETPSGGHRARSMSGFNRGYTGSQQPCRTCTPAASVAIRRYIEEGSKISRDLTARHPNRGERLGQETMDAIFFDLDGTLTDPKIGITRSIQYALGKLDH